MFRFLKFILTLTLYNASFLVTASPATTLNRKDAAPPTTDNVVELQRFAPKRSLVPRQQTTTLWENRWQTVYVGNVTIGGTVFPIMVDTGSSHTWVTLSNVSCTQTGFCPSKHLQLTANEKWHYPMLSKYNKGSALGGLIQRSVSLAGISISSQHVGVAWNITDFPLSSDIQGLLGLGLNPGTWYPDSPRGTYEYNTVFQNILGKGYKSFSIALRGSENPAGSVDPGILAFGGVPKSIVPNSPWARVYMDTTDPQHYQIPIDGYRLLNGDSVQLSPDERKAVIDSGTTISFLPAQLAVTFFNSIPGTGKITDICKRNADGSFNTKADEKCVDEITELWKVPCSSKGKALPFSVIINGIEFKLRTDTLITQFDTDFCVSGIQTANKPPFILGENFMRNVVAYHDFSDPKAPLMSIATYNYKP